jgi:ABC-2 type transport system ATP-binding protein
MASVEEICDDIALINKSEVVLSGRVDEVRNRFKSNTFSLCVAGDVFNAPSDGLYTVLSRTAGRTAGTLGVCIRKEKETCNSALLGRLAQEYEIISFAEELPSMNEVFLKAVAINRVQV